MLVTKCRSTSLISMNIEVVRFREQPNMALKPTRFRYAPAVGLALRWAFQTYLEIKNEKTFTNSCGNRST